MKANLTSELKLNGSKSEVKILYVRLPCNPIFPIGPIYLADHVHKCFPKIQQLILDLASLPILDVERILINSIKVLNLRYWFFHGEIYKFMPL